MTKVKDMCYTQNIKNQFENVKNQLIEENNKKFVDYLDQVKIIMDIYLKTISKFDKINQVVEENIWTKKNIKFEAKKVKGDTKYFCKLIDEHSKNIIDELSNKICKMDDSILEIIKNKVLDEEYIDYDRFISLSHLDDKITIDFLDKYDEEIKKYIISLFSEIDDVYIDYDNVDLILSTSGDQNNDVTFGYGYLVAPKVMTEKILLRETGYE